MRRFLLRASTIASTLTAILVAPILASAQSVKILDLPAMVVLVRHGETSPEVPGDRPLLPAGIKRSQDLVLALRVTAFSAIVTTQLTRTRETAKPIADALGLSPEVVPYVSRQREAHAKASAIRSATDRINVGQDPLSIRFRIFPKPDEKSTS